MGGWLSMGFEGRGEVGLFSFFLVILLGKTRKHRNNYSNF